MFKKKTFYFLLVFLTLLAVFFLERYISKSNLYKKFENQRILKIFYPQRLFQLTIETAGLQIKLKKQGLSWFMISPISNKADINVINECVNDLVGMDALDRFPAKNKDLDQFGLSSPNVLTLSIDYYQDKDFIKTNHVKLILGKNSFISDTEYILIKDTIFVSNRNLYNLFYQPVDYFRSKKIIELIPQKVTKMKIDHNNGIAFSIKKKGPLKYTTMDNKPVSFDKIMEYFQTIEKINITKFIDDPGNRPFKIKIPVLTLSIEEDYGARQIRIEFYQHNKQLYFKHYKSDSMFEIKQKFLSVLKKDKNSFLINPKI